MNVSMNVLQLMRFSVRELVPDIVCSRVNEKQIQHSKYHVYDIISAALITLHEQCNIAIVE